MANYNYDEGGQMAAYFIISFLALILVPLTVSSVSKSSGELTVLVSIRTRAHGLGAGRKVTGGCRCKSCLEQRARISKRERGSLLNPKLSRKTIFLILGWSLFAYLSFKVGNAKLDNKIYDPFEILGIKRGTTEKEIKSHFKKLSRKFHPDKVKPSGNETIESIANHFVDLTKAYKSLTDATIRQNWELYGHPDGRQEMSMGIALPKWIVEGKNNIYVLGFYALVIGLGLPLLVGRWWFGSRQRTKDGVNAKSAAAFFKTLKEESAMGDVVGSLGKAYEYENPSPITSAAEREELKALEKEIALSADKKWTDVKKLIETDDGKGPGFETRWKALVLIYAHLLRLPVKAPSLQQYQTRVLLQTPLLLNALLQIATARNWLRPTIAVMRLHAFLAQAIFPAFTHNDNIKRTKFAQLTDIKEAEAVSISPKATKLEELVSTLEEKGDPRAAEAKKVIEKWGRLELVDATFQVIGERIVTPGSIVFLVVKLRVSPPGSQPSEEKDLGVDETKRLIKLNEDKDNEFLMSRNNVEERPDEDSLGEYAHTPLWPGNRKPSWWVVIADDKTSRVVVPPMKVTDVPYSQVDSDRNFRSYKMQFQAPQSVGLFTWKLYIVSDTFVDEEVTKSITLKIDDLSALNADEKESEDDISDPDEDTLAGQMAAMRGHKVKKRGDEDEEEEDSDDESGTDDDEKNADSSDSDSD
ncbi:secretory subunit [Pleurotus pulmonarius]|nr:secretory subunit [Pleurotus pulmonarius]